MKTKTYSLRQVAGKLNMFTNKALEHLVKAGIEPYSETKLGNRVYRAYDKKVIDAHLDALAVARTMRKARLIPGKGEVPQPTIIDNAGATYKLVDAINRLIGQIAALDNRVEENTRVIKQSTDVALDALTTPTDDAVEKH